jgi:hypothetical protein
VMAAVAQLAATNAMGFDGFHGGLLPVCATGSTQLVL